ncbi:hypothetical protein NDU88_004017 [Pleurodeles waltl]|uniref:Uncharacterized protein n=1 Tax=Pleurodeles waltl TaxID=8319 RepID=A0AAV7VIZ9_PLEWA|nr:hypothetical protein NDU88_004017 [Pleurodeles waltl]
MRKVPKLREIRIYDLNQFLHLQLPDKVVVFERAVIHDVAALGVKNEHAFVNLSRPEKEAIRELNQNLAIIIKPAVKGGVIVIQNMETYHQEYLRLLSDTRDYKILPVDPTRETQREIRILVEEAVTNGWITDKEG